MSVSWFVSLGCYKFTLHLNYWYTLILSLYVGKCWTDLKLIKLECFSFFGWKTCLVFALACVVWCLVVDLLVSVMVLPEHQVKQISSVTHKIFPCLMKLCLSWLVTAPGIINRQWICVAFVCPLWAWGHRRIIPPRFLGEGVPRRQSHRRSGLATLPSLGTLP